MKTIIDLLAKKFAILDAGSTGSRDFLSKKLRGAATLIEIDPFLSSDIENGEKDNCGYYKNIILKKAIGAKKETRIFYRRKYWGSSSFLKPKEGLVKDYGLENYYKIIDELELETDTLEAVLNQAGVNGIDFLKTDLEGLDYEVLRSSPDIISKTLVLRSELRFQPFYEGEPYFREVADYLTKLGFEFVSLRPEVWKYKTANSKYARDGRLVWADAVFFLGIDKVKERYPTNYQLAYVKQIVLAKSLGLHNYAESIYERTKSELPSNLRPELEQFLRPALAFKIMCGAANLFSRIPGGSKLLTGARYVLNHIQKILFIKNDYRHIAPL